MLKLFPLPATVRVTLAPFPDLAFECRSPTTALIEQARAEARRAVADNPSDGALEEAYTVALLKMAMISWTGIADATGQPAPVTETNLAAFARLHPVGGLWRAEYLSSLIARALEGEDYAPAPSGTSAGARDIADGAGTGTHPVPEVNA